MRPLSPQSGKDVLFFFLLLLGKRRQRWGGRGERDGTWDRSHLLLTLDLFFLPCHSSWDFQLFHFIYFSYLLPRFFPLSFFAPYRRALYFPHMAGLAAALGVTLNGNAVLSHLFCRSGYSAFRAKDLLLSRPIYTDAAINLNVLCPCAIPSTGGQESIAKQHRDQISDQSQRDKIWIEAPSIQAFNSALQRWASPSNGQNQKFKKNVLCYQARWRTGSSPREWKNEMGWRGEGRAGSSTVVSCKTKQPPRLKASISGEGWVGSERAPALREAPNGPLPNATPRCMRVCAETTWNTATCN